MTRNRRFQPLLHAAARISVPCSDQKLLRSTLMLGANLDWWHGFPKDEDGWK